MSARSISVPAVLGIGAAFALGLAACGGGTPASPTGVAPTRTSIAVTTPAATASDGPITTKWPCFVRAGAGVFAADGCPIWIAAASQSVDAAAVDGAPSAPSGLEFIVSGTTVTITWSFAAGANAAASSFVVDAGSSAGQSDITSFDTGGTATSFRVQGVPRGNYFVRVRARNARGSSDPSNEVMIPVEGDPPSPCAGSAPGAPTGLSATVSGRTVTFSWTAPGGACAASSFVLQAGSSSGGSNLANFNTGSSATSYTATNVALGTYYVRVLAAAGGRQSGPSNEATVTVGQPVPSGCTPQPLALPATINGALTDSDCIAPHRSESRADLYTFVAAAGQQITITETSTAIDPYLVLADPAGAVIAEDDDSAGGLDARIQWTLTTAGTYSIEATAYAHGPRPQFGTYTLSVSATTPSGPLTILPASLPTLTVGSATSVQLTVTGGTGTGLVWSQTTGSAIAGLSLNSTTGLLSGTPTTAGAYSRRFSVTDSAGNTGSITYTGTVNPPARVTLTISPATLPTLTVETAASVQLTVSGGTGTGLVWSQTTGSPIAGLSLNSTTGLLSGTPTLAGSYSQGISVTDSAGNTGSITYAGTVAAARALLFVFPAVLPTLTVGVPYSAQLYVNSGSLTGLAWTQTSGSIAGVSLNRTTGILSGTPTTAGAYNVGFSVIDSGGNTGSTAYTGTVNAAPPPGGVDVQPRNAGNIGTIYKCRGGATQYSFTITAPSNVRWDINFIAPGASFNQTTGTGTRAVELTVAASATIVPGPDWYCDDGAVSVRQGFFLIMFGSPANTNIGIDYTYQQTQGNLLRR